MTRILVPRASGVLSALGLAAADRRADAQRTCSATMTRASTRWPTRSARRWAATAELEVAWDVRYRGQSHELTCAAPSATSCASASRRCTRSATATATPTARSSSSPSA